MTAEPQDSGPEKHPEKPTGAPSGEAPSSDLSVFGFVDEGWMHHVHDALQPEPPGSIGDYEIVEEIRRGGQGVVYRAIQPGTNRTIAIKRLVAGAFATKAAERRFEREIEAAAALRHPGIITVYGMEIVDGCPIMAMEWVDGVSVTAWAEGGEGATRPGVRSVLATFLRITDAVEHAHHRGILHRDLKPSNILIDKDGRPRVLDFGLSKVLHEEPGNTAVTLSDGFCGTPAYASPEHLEGGADRLDVRSDVYSLGVLLYEMLTGARPYDPDSGLRAYMDALDREAHRPPSKARSGVGREIDAVVRKALAPQREDRYSSVGEFATDIRRLLSDQPVLAVHRSALYELSKWIRRHKAVTALTVLLAGSLVGSLAGFLVFNLNKAEELKIERDAAAEQETKALALLNFLVHDMLLKIRPSSIDDDATVGDLLQIAVDQVSARFQDQPDLQGRVCFYLGETYNNLGQFQQAETLFRTALSRMQAFDELTFIEHAACELALAKVLRRVEKTDEAEAMFRSAEERFRTGLPLDYRLVAECMMGLAGCASNRNHIGDMRHHAQRGLEFAVGHLPENHQVLLDLREALALALSMSGELVAAKSQYETILNEIDREIGDENGRVASLLGRLSDIDEALGNLDEARDKSRRSLDLILRAYGDEHPATASALGDLAALMTEPEELVEAEKMLRQAKAITDRCRGEGTLVALVHETRMAQNLIEQGRLDEAIPILLGAHPRFESALGANSVWALRSLKSLARALSDAGKYAESLEAWRRAMQSPPPTPELEKASNLQCLNGMIETHRAAGQLDTARATMSKWFELKITGVEVPESETRRKMEKFVSMCNENGDTELANKWAAKLREWPSVDID